MNKNDKHLDLITDRVTPFLKECFIKDIRTLETANVTTRVTRISEEAFTKVKFENPVIEELLKDFFVKKAGEILKECKPAKADDEHKQSLEDIALSVLPDILDGTLFAEDAEWLKKYMKGELTLFIHGLLKHYFDVYYQKIEFAMLKNWDDAELLTFGKEQSRFKMSELDHIIKSGQGFNAWLGKKRGGKLILRELAEEYSLKEQMDEGFIDELVDKTQACDWNKDFRTFCLEKYDKK